MAQIHGMIDLETLSTRPDAVILTLGAIKFNPYTQDDPYDPLYFKVDVDAQTALGRHVMEDTINWWGTQPQEIQDEALGEGDRTSLEDTVKKINRWGVGIDVWWCQGPLFDFAILQNLYAQLDKPLSVAVLGYPRFKNTILSVQRNRNSQSRCSQCTR
jgi:hypothetical protein